jgi:hypothetical protein
LVLVLVVVVVVVALLFCGEDAEREKEEEGEETLILCGPLSDGVAACCAGTYFGSSGALERVDTAEVGV